MRDFRKPVRYIRQLAAGFTLGLAGIFAGAAAPPEAPVTQNTRVLQELEAHVNQKRPDNKIIFLDYDQMLVQYARDPDLLRFIMTDQLKKRGVTSDTVRDRHARVGEVQAKPETLMLSHDDFSSLYDALGGREHYNPANTMGTAVGLSGSAVPVCVVVAGTPDRSSISISHQYIDGFTPMRLTAPVEPEIQTKRIRYHEFWHCYDTKFRPLFEAQAKNSERDPKRYAWLQHRAETFAEVAALLTLAAEGELNIAPLQRDLRLLNAEHVSEFYVKQFKRSVDHQFYAPSVYYLSPAIDAVIRHIEENGLEKVKGYSWPDIEKISTELTQKHSLTLVQFSGFIDYLSNRKGFLAKVPATPEQQEALDFVRAHVKAAEAAEKRIAVRVPAEKPQPPSDIVLTAELFWAGYGTERREALAEEIQSRIKALPAGKLPEQVLVDMLDESRRRLHAAIAPEVIKKEEEFLTALRAFVTRGYLRDMIRAHENEKALAAAAVEEKPAGAAVEKPAAVAAEKPAAAPSAPAR